MAAIGTGARDLAAALRPLASFGWRMLATLVICRTVFVIYQWDAINGADRLAEIYTDGLVLDVALISLVLIVPLLAFPLLVTSRLLIGAWRTLLSTCLPGVLLAVVLVECATPSFVDPLTRRPTLIFFEYLNNPAGVAANLWTHFSIPIVCTVMLGLTASVVSARRLRPIVSGIRRPVAFLPALVVMMMLLAPWLATFGYIAETVAADHRHPSIMADQPVRMATYIPDYSRPTMELP